MKGKKRVVITGMGIICATGGNLGEFMASLWEGKGGIRKITLFDISGYPSQVAAQIERYDPLGSFDKRELRRLSRADQFVLIAAQEALADAELRPGPGDREMIGVCLGAGAGGMHSAEVYHRQLLAGARPRPSLLVPFIPSYATDQLAERYELQGPKATITTACSSSATSIAYGAELIRLGEAEVMVCGGGEALSELTFGGFCSLKVMASLPCRPFDTRRQGLSLGEGAAILILENRERALGRGAKIYGELLGYSIGGEAFHITAPEETGREEARIMKEALQDAGIEAKEVDYINAHGTGTILNDRVETLAIKEVWGQEAYQIPVSSTKSMIGHCLGAAGGMEAVASLLAIHHHFLPPTAGFERGDEICDLDYVPLARKEKTEIVLSNSFAFGGNCTALIFAKEDL
ncbi:MAG: beta-ketoacyl-[acyl-carrier-protein] synthase family protein [Deltaproteobacteria bacterium]|nr:beta-ketoacyl-[acyl-carrier-protein] synthase family protein [Deltaproteobacteria bacterium]